MHGYSLVRIYVQYISTQAVLTFHSNTHTQTAPLIRVQHISSLTDTLEPSIRVTALLITW